MQEVTIPEFPAFAGCKAYVNAGTNQNGTVAIFHDTMRSEKWTRCPRGGGIAAWFGFLYLVKIYTSSGNSRSVRELFCNEGLTYILRIVPQHFITGGDFKCVLDSTGA